MSGHDIADEPHETTHEMVTECRGSCGQKPPCSNCADIAVQWTRWPNVKPREAAERRSGPRNNWSTTR